jgi:hypothetical protein
MMLDYTPNMVERLRWRGKRFFPAHHPCRDCGRTCGSPWAPAFGVSVDDAVAGLVLAAQGIRGHRSSVVRCGPCSRKSLGEAKP